MAMNAAARFANRLRQLCEEIPVERLHAARDHEEQNEREWDQREVCCRDCSVERSRAFEFDGSPFLPSDEEAQ